jgi:hypothetical protein
MKYYRQHCLGSSAITFKKKKRQTKRREKYSIKTSSMINTLYLLQAEMNFFHFCGSMFFNEIRSNSSQMKR